MSNDRVMNDREIEVLIVCDNVDRVQKWVEVLGESGVTSVYSYGSGMGLYKYDCVRFLSPGEGEDRRDAISGPAEGLPTSVECVLVHAGNRSEWENDVETKKVFIFDTPGNPTAWEGQLPILRSTGANDFEVTASDALEIVEYCLGTRKRLPECCQPRRGLEFLSALAILCQGYLAVHIDPENHEIERESGDEDPSGEISCALKTMEWHLVPFERLPEEMRTVEGRARLRSGDPGSAMIGVRQASWWRGVLGDEEDTLSRLKHEWGDAPRLSEVEPFLRQIYTGSGVVRPLYVARTFMAIHTKLSGSTDE